MTRRILGPTLLALLLTVATATAAIAHPAFNPSRVAPGDEVEALLVVPHGCNPAGGMPDDTGASPTVEVALQLPEDVTVTPRPVDGWSVEVDDAERVITWRDDGGATTQPIMLPVDLSASGEVGEERFLSAYQGCEQGEFRWIGTPDDEAEWPAVRLTLAETTAERTAEMPVATGQDQHAADGMADDAMTSEDGQSMDADAAGVPEMTTSQQGRSVDTDAAGAPEATASQEGQSMDADAADAAASDEASAQEEVGETAGSGVGWWLLAAVVVAALVIVGLLLRRSRRRERVRS